MKANRIELPRGAFSYLEEGPEEGPLVLLFHGFPDIPRTFEAQLKALAQEGYHAVAPWLRGYSPSVLEGPYDRIHLSDDMIALAEALGGGKKVALVGHDWGAVLGYSAVARAPERFTHFVAMAVPHPTATLENMSRSLRQVRRSWYALFFQLGKVADYAVERKDFALIEKLWRDWSPGLQMPTGYLDELKGCLAESLPAPIEYYRTQASLSPKRVRDIRAQGEQAITVPTLHLHGAYDGCMGFEMSEGEERFFRGRFEKHAVPGAGHFLQLDQPDEVSARILAWLRS